MCEKTSPETCCCIQQQLSESQGCVQRQFKRVGLKRFGGDDSYSVDVGVSVSAATWSGRINPSDFNSCKTTLWCWITWLLLLLLLISSAWRWRDEIHDENSLSRPSASRAVLLGSNPQLSALIWLPAGGRPALKSLPSFSIVERGIFALWKGGGDRNLLVIRDGKFNLVWGCGGGVLGEC